MNSLTHPLLAVAVTLLVILILLRVRVTRPLRRLATEAQDMLSTEVRELSVGSHHRASEIGSLVYSFNALVKRLMSNEARYREILENVSVVAWEADPELNFTYVSSHAERLLGYPVEKWYDKHFWESQVHPEDVDRAVRHCLTATAQGLDHEFEYRMLTRDGRIVWVRDIVNLVYQGDEMVGLRGILVDITERKEAELQLQNQLNFEEMLADISREFVIGQPGDLDRTIHNMLRQSGEFFKVDRAYLFQLTPDEAYASNTHEWCSSDIQPQIDQLQKLSTATMPWWLNKIKSGECLFIADVEEMPAEARVEQLLLRSQGVKSLLAVPVLSGDKVTGFFGFDSVCGFRHWTDKEISLMYVMGSTLSAALAQHQVQASLRHEAAILNSLLNSIPDMVSFKSVEGEYLGCNSEFARFVGRSKEEVVGKRAEALFDSDTADLFSSHDKLVLEHSEPQRNEHWMTYPNGERVLFDTLKAPMRGGGGEIIGLLGVSRNITERRESEEQIRNLAFFDTLTHLPNRRLLLDRLQHAMHNSARQGQHGCLLFIDLDNFKTLNDTQGHDVGDRLLVSVAQRLNLTIRDIDTVARLGGDEFIILLEGLSRDEARAVAEAEHVAEKVLTVLNEPYLLGQQMFHSTPSLGVTLFRGTGVGMEELLKRADMAMYRAKASGRNMIRFFDPSMQAVVEERAALETDLRFALEHQQFELHFQPQVNQLGQVIGAEALLRWCHHDRGMVSPAQFIPLAEDTGLILPIGHWVLKSACERLKNWEQQKGMSEITLAVNISARQFRHVGFVDEISQVLHASGADPTRLKLEITESMMLDDIEGTIERLSRLKALGVSLSIDDFGTGYSSLSYLKRLPLDQLKIDQSFVRDLTDDHNDAVIVQAIIAMAQRLGLEIIAEGVETEPQYQFLLEHGCSHFQGYLFSRPLPLSDFEHFILINQRSA
ncbi:EAL domain-containing protein [Nitrincola sp. MINF-07-Sa-05]|uniref:EAL domain-containing protein n=1 Tax=Nitrincola salilacus TaxID=3400273 RepID=UPI003917FC22